MRRLRAAVLIAAIAGLAACDDVEALLDEAAEKGGDTDVPAEARGQPAPVDEEALRRRVTLQSFN